MFNFIKNLFRKKQDINKTALCKLVSSNYKTVNVNGNVFYLKVPNLFDPQVLNIIKGTDEEYTETDKALELIALMLHDKVTGEKLIQNEKDKELIKQLPMEVFTALLEEVTKLMPGK